MKNWFISHKKQVLAGACVLIVLAALLGIFFHHKKEIAKTAAKQISPHEESEIDAWGEVNYTRMEDISIDFPSVVTGVQVKEGDRVTLSQSLVNLDLSEHNGNIRKLKQQLAAENAALPAAKQEISALESDITETQNQIARKTKEYNYGTNSDLKLLKSSLGLAQHDLATSKSDLARYQALYHSGAIPEVTLNQYKDAVVQRQKAVNDVQLNIQKTKTALKDELDQLNVLLKSKQDQLSQAKLANTANVAKQQGGISSVQIDLDTMTAKTSKDYIKGNKIVSNIKNGIVQNIAVTDGSHLGIQGAPTKVLQIIDADSLTVCAEVDEEFIDSIKINEPVRIVLASSPDASLSGKVVQVPDAAVEKDGRRIVKVQVKPNDPQHLLKPGYTADVYFKR